MEIESIQLENLFGNLWKKVGNLLESKKKWVKNQKALVWFCETFCDTVIPSFHCFTWTLPKMLWKLLDLEHMPNCHKSSHGWNALPESRASKMKQKIPSLIIRYWNKTCFESEHVLNTCWIQGFSCCKFLVIKVVLVKVADLCIWKCCQGNGAARRHFEANAVRSTRSAAVRSKAQRCKISQSDQTKHKTSKVQTHSKHQPTSYIILSVVQSPSNKQANIATFRSRKCLRFFSPIRPSSTLPSSRLCAGRGRAGRGGRAGGCCRGRRGRVEFGFSFAWLLAMGIGYMDVGPLNSL